MQRIWEGAVGMSYIQNGHKFATQPNLSGIKKINLNYD